MIVSSILSKKIAGGAETIVLDVKCGSGAFMPDLASARALAAGLADTGRRCGVKVRLAITDMSQPLGCAVGNALEVEEARRILLGLELNPNEARFRGLCLSLAGLTLFACAVAPSLEDGVLVAEKALVSGAAAGKAREWFAAQGGSFDAPVLEARPSAVLLADRSGWISEIDARAVGEMVVDLGGGRKLKTDELDLQVGVRVPKGVGEPVSGGEVLAEVVARTREEAEEAVASLAGTILLSDSQTAKRDPVVEIR